LDVVERLLYRPPDEDVGSTTTEAQSHQELTTSDKVQQERQKSGNATLYNRLVTNVCFEVDGVDYLAGIFCSPDGSNRMVLYAEGKERFPTKEDMIPVSLRTRATSQTRYTEWGSMGGIVLDKSPHYNLIELSGAPRYDRASLQLGTGAGKVFIHYQFAPEHKIITKLPSNSSGPKNLNLS